MGNGRFDDIFVMIFCASERRKPMNSQPKSRTSESLLPNLRFEEKSILGWILFSFCEDVCVSEFDIFCRRSIQISNEMLRF